MSRNAGFQPVGATQAPGPPWTDVGAKQAMVANLISIVIPTLNEEARIEESLRSLQGVEDVEIIVVDGGSEDRTADLARRCGARVIISPRGRAAQMNAGAAAARGEILLFLHGDTKLPPDFALQTRRVAAQPNFAAGAFRLRIEGRRRGFRIIEAVANFRAKQLQTPYGDQALFVKADRFAEMKGFPQMPIMEDFEFVRRARRRGRILIAPADAVTSGRRWIKLGLWRTTLLNWLMVAAYWAGVSPARLAVWYGRRPSPRGAELPSPEVADPEVSEP